jgi:hypothetical protein
MIGYFFLGIGVLLLIGFGLRAYANADPRTLRLMLTTLAGVVALGFVGFMLASGRGGALLGLLFFLYPLWRNRQAIAARAKAARGPAAGQSSTAETAWLRLRLDHDSGAMEGEVLQGQFAGQTLEGLNESDLLALRHECAADEDSVRLLEAYLDRRFGPGWRPAEAQGDGAGAREKTAESDAAPDGMSLDEARAVLGLAPDADEEAIRAAHRRLLLKTHPDQGGSDWLAARINQAKDRLLKARRDAA